MNGYYEMTIRKQIFIDAEITNIFFYVDLQKIYLKIVAPIKIGHAGYSVVKDKDLAIIMHHAENQIGMDAIYDCSTHYPDLDLNSLKEWIKFQLEQESGCGVIDSYVWDDKKLPPVRRIVAYTTIKFQNEQCLFHKWLR